MPVIFNGQSYNRVEDMAPEARQAYEQAMGMLADKNQNGMADAMEGPAAPGAPAAGAGMFGSTQFVVNGQVVTGMEGLPPEARQAIEKAMGALDGNQNGVPDFFENMPGLTPEARQALGQAMGTLNASHGSAPASSQNMPGAPMISEEGHFPIAPMTTSQPGPPQAFPKTPTLSYKPEDPDAGRRRLVLVLVAALVLLVLAGAAGAVLYSLYYLVPR